MEKYIIPHAKVIKPLRQGQLDTLCGLYSAINAIRLAVYPKRKFTKYHARVMVEEGLEYLSQRRNRLLSVMTEGMSKKLRLAVTNHLLKIAHEEWEVELELIKPELDKAGNSRFILESFIEANLQAGNPVCININGYHRHYTIICGYNSRSYFLYDSDGLASIQRSLISIKGDTEDVRHDLPPNGLFSVVIN